MSVVGASATLPAVWQRTGYLGAFLTGMAFVVYFNLQHKLNVRSLILDTTG